MNPSFQKNREVGPVLVKNELTEHLLKAICEDNKGATIVDRGSYVRVLVEGRCRLVQATVQKYSGKPFLIPRDLELVLSSFQGKMTVRDQEVIWRSH